MINKLPYCIEHQYPDYSLYPEYKDLAVGFLTRGCPRTNHGFCITPKKDGCRSVKVADITEFWDGQKNISLLDQNLFACRDRIELINQLKSTNAKVEFVGGSDIRFVNDEVIAALQGMKVKDYHFAWDDPKEDLESKFKSVIDSGLVKPKQCGVYVLTNYWSDNEQDLYRVETLKRLGYAPFVMIYDKQKFVDSRGRWLPGVGDIYTREELIRFKTAHHMQRYTASRNFLYSCDFEDYEPYKKWLRSGCPVPSPTGQMKLNL